MGDGDLGIHRARRRDWTPDDDMEAGAVSAGASSSAAELRRKARDAAGHEKLANWIRDAAGDTCTKYAHPLHDFDRCVSDPNPRAPGAIPRTPALFLPEDGDANVISPADVHQMELGDCALLATLAGLAGSAEGRTAIGNAIAERKNENGEVVGYSVTIYQSQWHLLGPKTFSQTRVEISASEPYVYGHAMATGDRTHDEIWPLIFEKAYAKLRGGYDAIAHGEPARDAMEAVLGKEVRHAGIEDVTDQELRRCLDAHALVVLSSNRPLGRNPDGLVAGHAYFVTGREDRGGGNVLYKLGNPWNGKETIDVPYAKLAEYFHCVDVGEP